MLWKQKKVLSTDSLARRTLGLESYFRLFIHSPLHHGSPGRRWFLQMESPPDFAIRTRVCPFIASLADTSAPAESDHQSDRGVLGPHRRFRRTNYSSTSAKSTQANCNRLALTTNLTCRCSGVFIFECAALWVCFQCIYAATWPAWMDEAKKQTYILSFSEWIHEGSLASSSHISLASVLAHSKSTYSFVLYI